MTIKQESAQQVFDELLKRWESTERQLIAQFSGSIEDDLANLSLQKKDWQDRFTSARWTLLAQTTEPVRPLPVDLDLTNKDFGV